MVQQARNSRKRQDKCSFRIEKWHRAVTSVPASNFIALGVDNYDRAADHRGDLEAAPSRREQKLFAESLPLLRAVDGNARQAKAGHLAAGETAPHHVRRSMIGKGCVRQIVETENGFFSSIARKVLAAPWSWLCRA